MNHSFHLDIPPNLVLPSSQSVLFDDETGILTRVDVQEPEGTVTLLSDALFTCTERCVLLPLLLAYPYHCPTEVMHAHFTLGNMHVTEEAVQEARKYLQAHLQVGKGDKAYHGIRNVISRMRQRLIYAHFEMEVYSVLETGYILHPLKKLRYQPRAERVYRPPYIRK